METVIKGFRLRVTSLELQNHCFKRSDYHKLRAEEKEIELPNIKEAFEKIQHHSLSTNISGKSAASYNFNEDSIECLEKDIKTHKEKVIIFKFYAEHLFNETYDLDENDLRRLEIIR